MQPPPHPLPALTTYELRDRRRELEDALENLPDHAPGRALLQRQLDEVLAEQQSRTRIQQEYRP